MKTNRHDWNKVKRYLIHWFWYEESIHELEGELLSKARVLFQALKHLDEEELRMLQLKYHELASLGLTVKDYFVSYYFGLKENIYKKKRIAIEKKLIPIILELEEKEGVEM